MLLLLMLLVFMLVLCSSWCCWSSWRSSWRSPWWCCWLLGVLQGAGAGLRSGAVVECYNMQCNNVQDLKRILYQNLAWKKITPSVNLMCKKNVWAALMLRNPKMSLLHKSSVVLWCFIAIAIDSQLTSYWLYSSSDLWSSVNL